QYFIIPISLSALSSGSGHQFHFLSCTSFLFQLPALYLDIITLLLEIRTIHINTTIVDSRVAFRFSATY
ncbi:hypothetical protein, partial [Chitinophaga sp.]|uniref:hypothetical protein n=1 Tax=Chitinophaga sp. TaxID=1869181 RepID=UPI002CC4C99D